MFPLRSVQARLVERFVFNFRVKPEALATRLPASYLQPQTFHGWSVVSLCILKLDQVRFTLFPSFLGCKTISCAYRCGVINTSGQEPEPAVYILGRYSDHPLISRLEPLIFSDVMPRICPSITQKGSQRTIHITTLDGQPLFTADIKPAAQLSSQAFDSLDAFAGFLQKGVSSYTPALDGEALAQVDLQKEDTTYEAYDATIKYHLLSDLWQGTQLIYDSVIRATGRHYKWVYRGLHTKGGS